MNSQFPKPGDNFEGFHIQSVLGSGGYSKVFRVTENASGRHYALKVANPPDTARGETALKRFAREAAIIKKLESPHTVRLFRSGTSGGFAYMVLELVEGMNAAQLVNDLGTADSLVIGEVLAQCLTGLAEAHRHGVIHRDLKPDNVMIVAENDDLIAKLIDFGVAKLGAEQQEKLTREGYVVGTPHFMSPEQIMAKPITPASDIYSLGMVAYFIATGGLPFRGDMVAAFEAHLGPEPFRIPDSAALDPRLCRIIDRMLQKDLSARYTTCEEALRELAGFADPVERRRAFRTTMQTLPILGAAALPDLAKTEKDLVEPHFESPPSAPAAPVKRGKGIKKRPPNRQWQPGSLEVDDSKRAAREGQQAGRQGGYTMADFGWFALTALFAVLTLVVLILRGS